MLTIQLNLWIHLLEGAVLLWMLFCAHMASRAYKRQKEQIKVLRLALAEAAAVLQSLRREFSTDRTMNNRKYDSMGAQVNKAIAVAESALGLGAKEQEDRPFPRWLKCFRISGRTCRWCGAHMSEIPYTGDFSCRSCGRTEA